MKKYAFVVCLFIVLGGCDKESKFTLPKAGAEKPSAEMKGASPGAVDDVAEHERVLAKINQEMAELEQKLDEQRRRSQQAAGEAKVELEKQVSALDQDMKDLKAKAVSLKTAAAGKWDELRVDLAQAMDRMKISIERISQGSPENHP